MIFTGLVGRVPLVLGSVLIVSLVVVTTGALVLAIVGLVRTAGAAVVVVFAFFVVDINWVPSHNGLSQPPLQIYKINVII